MSARHTPGPWEHRERKTRGGQTVHEIHQKQRYPRHGTYRIATLEFSDDASVIAAAPDMRATLETIMLKAVRQQADGGDLMDFQDRLRECADLARAVLARADT